MLSPTSISRIDYKRATVVYADIKEGADLSPLEVAHEFEKRIFPDLLNLYPSAVISFTGEVKDTRESGQDFRVAMIMVLFFIYTILAVMFNSMIRPFIIMLAIPISAVGIIIAFWLHEKTMFGFLLL